MDNIHFFVAPSAIPAHVAPKKNIRCFDKNERQCITCTNQTSSETCDGCRGQKPRDYFDELVLQNARKYGRRKICLLCKEKGLSPMDIQTYPCYGCGQKGHKKFMPNTLYRYKKEKKCTTMLCLDCTERRVNIQKALDARDSLRCTCPGHRRKQRCHIPTNEKCDLYASRHMGEKQWPGKTKELLSMTYVLLTNWRNDTNMVHSKEKALNRKYVRCFPDNELSKELSLSSYPPSTHSRPFHPPIRCSFGFVFFVNYHSSCCSFSTRCIL